MAINRIYKVYPANEFDNIDKSKVSNHIRWNLANTEFIVEFIEPPHGNTIVLTHDEAKSLMQTEAWMPMEDLTL